MAGPVAVFLSHAPADATLLAELEEHLSALVREGAILPWSKGQLLGGEARRERIEEHLRAAPVVILLVSSSYFASDELHDDEMSPAIARARAGSVRVIPILARPFDPKASALAGLKVLPANGLAVTKWADRDEAWVSVVAALRSMLRHGSDSAARPEPAYDNDEIRALSGRLERTRDRQASLRSAGESTAEIDREILDLRRHLREGGHLRAGDSLEDGRYLLLRPLGRGGFGSVWAAFDRERGEQVAIKVLHSDQAREPSRRDRFFRGARVMESLAHPGVVKVLAPKGEDGGYLYFVMELVDGEDLQRAVVAGRFPRAATVPLILLVGEALGHAHEKNLVHRDVKPANILLDASRAPRLTDFDLVAANDTTGGTRTGALGTALFTSPEQMSNAKDADARSDVYALGMTAIFCLHGGSLPDHTLRRPELVIQALACDDGVKRVLTRAIELRPEDRFENAQVFCQALLETTRPAPLQPAIQPDQPVIPHGAMPRVRPSSYIIEATTRDGHRRGAAWTRIAAGAAGVTLVGAIIGFLYPRPPEPVPVAVAAMGANLPASVAIPRPSSPPPASCPDSMVLIPAATFTMGSNDGDPDEKPPHQVKLSAFCLDKLEVTVAAYRQCTKEERNGVRCAAAFTTVQWTVASAGDQKFFSQFCNGAKSDNDLHPINCVDWTQADTYCTWAGGNLPSEAQWEYAARGTDGRKYPWGNDNPGAKLLNACGSECRAMADRRGKKGWKAMYEADDGAEVTAEVGKYPDGASPFGVLDMSGNVWEWVADWYAPYPAGGKTITDDPKGPSKPGGESRRVLRGGGWYSVDASRVRAAFRDRGVVTVRSGSVGFRCSRGPK